MHANTGVEIGIDVAHDRRRRSACRKPRDIDALRIHAMPANDLLGDPRKERRLALPAALILRPEPIPALRDICAQSLLGIGDEEAMLLGEVVHPRSGREVVGGLGAAVQHHDQCALLIIALGGNVEFVFPRTSRVRIGRCCERGSFRRLRTGMETLLEGFGHRSNAFDRLLEAGMRPVSVWGFRPWLRRLVWRFGFGHGVFGVGTVSCACRGASPEHALNQRRRLHELAQPGEAGRLGHFREQPVSHCRALSFAGEEYPGTKSQLHTLLHAVGERRLDG